MLPTREVLKLLEIDRERIKYYKKMGVFCAESKQPGYYTEEDVNNLKKLIMLGKAGLTCDDIKRVQSGENLADVIKERRQKIKEKMERMLNSLTVSLDLLGKDVQYESLEFDHRWNIVSQYDIDEGVMEFEDEMPLSLIRTIECPYCDMKQEVALEDYVYDEDLEDENDEESDVIYRIDSEEDYECEHCGRIFRIEGWTREFLAGTDTEYISVYPVEDIEDDDEEQEDEE